jgi:phosphoribosylglycinamide formyltransferase 1
MPMPQRLPIVVLISGRGSNMRVLAERIAQGTLNADIKAVISDQPSAGGLQIAQSMHIATETLSPKSFADRNQFDAALAARVASYQPALIVLAGYMRILSAAFVHQYQGKLINIHPSLLPKYPGLHTHQRALDAGDTQHGCSVHFVTEALDAGPLIIQGRVPVLQGDNETTLSARVQRAEHIIYPQAVQWIAEGRITLREGVTWMDNQPMRTVPVVEVT